MASPPALRDPLHSEGVIGAGHAALVFPFVPKRAERSERARSARGAFAVLEGDVYPDF
jgi:hypothetical protein